MTTHWWSDIPPDVWVLCIALATVSALLCRAAWSCRTYGVTRAELWRLLMREDRDRH